MQIKLHLDGFFRFLEINPDLNFDGHRKILPKQIQINGKLNLDKLDIIMSCIDSSILSFGRINVEGESLEDLQ
jgi:hypothetical protein